MPLFFFHVRGDVQRPDPSGIDLADAAAAWAEALQFAKDLQGEPDGAFAGRRWSLVVDDDGGRLLFRLDFDQTA